MVSKLVEAQVVSIQFEGSLKQSSLRVWTNFQLSSYLFITEHSRSLL